MGTTEPKAASKFFILTLGALLLFFNVVATMLMEYSKVNGEFPYNPATTVVMSEFIKLCLSIGGFYGALQEPTAPQYTLEFSSFMKFAIPGLLYAISNVGNFIVLQYISGTLYQIFNNMKIVTTALCFRWFLNKPLKIIQWICLIFLLIGMVVATPMDASGQDSSVDWFTGLLIMIVMSAASAFAGVYSEFLLKFSADNSHFQNMQLYIWGVVICVTQFLYSGSSEKSFFSGYDLLTWVIILMNAFYGQVIAFTLKYADNIVKVYANSLASITTALLSYGFFAAPLTMGLCNGSILVGLSILIYYGDHEKMIQDDTILCEKRSNVEDI